MSASVRQAEGEELRGAEEVPQAAEKQAAGERGQGVRADGADRRAQR